MRNIQFRGKTKQGKWLYGNLVQGSVITSILTEKDVAETPINFLGSRLVEQEVLPATVGQHTGFKDKNDREIYEGDILRNVPRTVTYIAQWSEAGYWKAEALSALHHDVLRNICDNFVIIGNIHDNKDLLAEGI